METYYDKEYFYKCDLRPCPECGGQMRMLASGRPALVCSECKTVYVPDIPTAVADWWNNAKED